MTPPDWPLIYLPVEPCSLTLICDCSLDGADLDRFVAAGGTVNANGWRVYVAGGLGGRALAMLTGSPTPRETGGER